MRRNTVSIGRYQRVLALRQEGKTFQEIAGLLGVSRQRVWQIHERASKRIGMTRTVGNHGNKQTKAA